MSPYRVALLFSWDVVVDVFISPVEHQLLFLSVVDPHDGSGDLLDDVLQVSQLSRTRMRHFLRGEEKKRSVRENASYSEDAQTLERTDLLNIYSLK